MRRVGQTISVRTQDSCPTQISWNGDTLRVEDLIECWVHQTGWWKPKGGERRVYYRLRTESGIIDVYRSGEEWTLSRVVD